MSEKLLITGASGRLGRRAFDAKTRKGFVGIFTNDVEHRTGHKPKSLQQSFAENASALSAAPQMEAK